jgi:type IX secretion system substrate protein
MLYYSIHTKSGLAAGTQFKNQASIYFDYNAPVRTNQTLNTLGEIAKVNTVASVPNSSFSIYPNPASTAFTAVINSDIAGSVQMRISDISGKTLINKTIQVQTGAQTVTVDINEFTPGIYLVNLSQNGKSQTQKLVVIKS